VSQPVVKFGMTHGFAVYVLHLAIIVPLALALSGIQMNLSLKFLLVAPIAAVLCYLVACGMITCPWLWASSAALAMCIINGRLRLTAPTG
jgi:hypothetical protein